MSVYLETLTLLALQSDDALFSRAERFLRDCDPTIVVSDFAKAEFASGVARRVQLQVTTATDAREAFAAFDISPTKFAR